MDQTRRRRRRLAAALLTLAVLAPAAPALAHTYVDNWWQYDKVVWKYGFQRADDLNKRHDRWHERPKAFQSREARARAHRGLHHEFRHRWRQRHFNEALSWHQGKATWYGHQTGTVGACGVRLYGNYAAHRSLPCFSKVSVRHGNRYVWVTILDRGPFGSRDRIIDLNKQAFRQLAPLSDGVIYIKAVRVKK